MWKNIYINIEGLPINATVHLHILSAIITLHKQIPKKDEISKA